MIDTDDAFLKPRTGDDPRVARDLAVVHDLVGPRAPRRAGGRLGRLARRQAEDAGRSVRVQALERLGR